MKNFNLKGKTNQLLIGILVIFLVGCGSKVKLVGEYDEIIDKSVHQIESKTTSHFKKIVDYKGSGDGGYVKNKEFYSNIKGDVQSLIVRADTIENGLKKTPLTNNFKDLQEQYDDLEILHQTPFSEIVILNAQAAFDRSYRAIVKHMIYIKWNQEKPTN